MEPIEKPLIIHAAMILETGIDSISHWFSIEGMTSVRFWTKDDHLLRPGDRVKITITKEPNPDALPC